MQFSKPSWNPLKARLYSRRSRRTTETWPVVETWDLGLGIWDLGFSIPKLLRLDHHLDGAVHLVLEVPDRGRQLIECKRMRVKRRLIELLLRDERCRTADRALPLAADAVEIDVVRHDVADVDERGLLRKGAKTNAAAALQHVDSIVDRVCGPRTLEHQVRAAPIGQLAHSVDHRLARRVDDDIGTDARSHAKAAVDDIGEDHGTCAKRLPDGDG